MHHPIYDLASNNVGNEWDVGLSLEDAGPTQPGHLCRRLLGRRRRGWPAAGRRVGAPRSRVVRRPAASAYPGAYTGPPLARPNRSQQAPPPAEAGQFLLVSIWRAEQARGEAKDGECHWGMAKEGIRA